MFREDLRNARVAKVHNLMKEMAVDGLYLEGIAINYLRGFRDMHLFVPANAEPIVMCGDLERENPLKDYRVGLEEKWIQECCLHTDAEIIRVCQESGAATGKLGVFLGSMAVGTYEHLKQLMPETEIVDITKPYLDLMNINDDLNMSYGEKSAQIVQETFEAFCAECKIGSSVAQLNLNMNARMIAAGCTGTFNMIRPVYRKPENKGVSPDVVCLGDAFFCEITGCYEDVWTQHIYPVLIGEDNEMIQAMAKTNLDAFKAVLPLIKPGIRSDILHQPVADVFANSPFCGPATFSCVPVGHYMGMQMDGGTFSPGKNALIEEDMIIVIHSTARDDASDVRLFGPGCSLKVTKDGCESFYPLYESVRVI